MTFPKTARSLGLRALRERMFWKLLLFALLVIAILMALGIPSRGILAGAPSHDGHHDMPMTDAAMKQRADAWWAAHPRVGRASVQAPSATFRVGNFFFDLDNNLSTKVDTAKIMTGQSVLWQWVGGFHTVTNGSSSDPNPGNIFDQPSDNTHLQFEFTFNVAGTYHFYCRLHDIDMNGVVRVRSTTGVEPGTDHGKLGFTARPSPNPTQSGVDFRFELSAAGPARAEVLDVNGRRIATVIDHPMEAGSYAASWNGWSDSGSRAGPGVYYLHLKLPGFDASRRIVVTR